MKPCQPCGAIGETCCETAQRRLETCNSLSRLVDKLTMEIETRNKQIQIMNARIHVDSVSWQRDENERQVLRRQVKESA